MSKSKRLMVFVLLVSVFCRAVAAGYGARTSKEAITKSPEMSPARAVAASSASTVVALMTATITPVHAQMGNGQCENIQKNGDADRVEKIYKRFAVGNDAAGEEGYLAAQKAEEQLRLDFLSSFQNPQMNAANQTAWDREEAQLISDSLKYGGNRTLDAAAMYWGETHLSLPVASPQELLAQADTIQVSEQPGEREYAEYMANYLAARFQSLNRLAPYYHSASDDIEGREVPLGLAALQAGLRIDEVDRTLQAASIVHPGC
jgi:hypothetical protein